MPVKRESMDPDHVPATKKKERRLESLRDTMIRIVGADDTQLSNGIKVRAQWGTKMFKFSQNDLDFSLKQNLSTKLSCSRLSALNRTTSTHTGSSAIVDNYELQMDEIRSRENTLLINTGFSIINIDSTARLIALSCLFTADQLRPSLSPQNSITEPSLIKIYEFSASDFTLNVYSTIKVSSGAVICLKFNPLAPEYLAVVLGSGKVCILPIVENGSFELNDENLKFIGDFDANANIVEWASDGNSLFIGYTDGSIARYGLDNDLHFVFKPHNSIVTSISCTFDAVFSTSVDGTQYTTKNDDLRIQMPTARLKTHPITSQAVLLLNSFVCTDDMGGSRIIPVACPEVGNSTGALTQHCTDITRISGSYIHPFIASGSRDGSVHIGNSARHAFMTRRKRKDHLDIELFQVEYSRANSAYKFTDTLKTNHPGSSAIHSNNLLPQQVLITGLKWHPELPVLITAVGGGILRIDNLE